MEHLVCTCFPYLNGPLSPLLGFLPLKVPVAIHQSTSYLWPPPRSPTGNVNCFLLSVTQTISLLKVVVYVPLPLSTNFHLLNGVPGFHLWRAKFQALVNKSLDLPWTKLLSSSGGRSWEQRGGEGAIWKGNEERTMKPCRESRERGSWEDCIYGRKGKEQWNPDRRHSSEGAEQAPSGADRSKDWCLLLYYPHHKKC